MIKIEESVIPKEYFNWFYNTQWSEHVDDWCMLANEEGEDIPYDDMTDEQEEQYWEAVKEKEAELSEDICYEMYVSLHEINLDIKCNFIKLDSPEFYNYRTDQIEVDYEMEERTMGYIVKFLKEAGDKWDKFIKGEFTAYDWYMPYYPDDWQKWIENLEAWEFDDIWFPSIITFLLDFKDGITPEDFFDKVINN